MTRVWSRLAERPLWIMAPGLGLLLVIVGGPFLASGWISVIDLDQVSLRDWVDAPFVAAGNYLEAIRAAGMLHSLWVSVAFALVTTAIAAPLGVLAALTVNGRFRGQALVRCIYLVPYVLPGFVTGLLWRFMLQPDGVVNRVLGTLGLGGGRNWLIGGNSFWSLVTVDVWASWAFIYLMSLAGLQTISHELYEAAEVDGATTRDKLRYIVLPQLRGPLSLALLLSTLQHFNNLTLPFVLFGVPAPDPVNLLPMNVYTTSFQQFRFGLGAAMSMLTLVILVVPVGFYLRATRLDAVRED
ncbi:sugar ABC transporter permease [Oryzihumus sp.]|uniref:carbohydrate ABC transporter permease n=1 Tax=Oryzihumus sp. TaxID=1968903 RepID=UPI002ED7ADCB